MTDLQLWATLVGAGLPFVIALILQTSWGENVRKLVTFAACLAAAAGTALFQGDLTGRRFISAALFVLVATLATYKVFWKPSGIAPAVERASDLRPPAAALWLVLLFILSALI